MYLYICNVITAFLVVFDVILICVILPLFIICLGIYKLRYACPVTYRKKLT